MYVHYVYVVLLSIIAQNHCILVYFLFLSQTSGSNQVDLDSVMAVINRIRWYPIILAVVYILPLVHRQV
jgi:hypothetical protein